VDLFGQLIRLHCQTDRDELPGDLLTSSSPDFDSLSILSRLAMLASSLYRSRAILNHP